MDKRKGIAFTIDAILALLVILAAIPLISVLTSRDTSQQTAYEYLHLQSEDTVDVLSKMKIRHVRNEPVIDNLFREGVLKDNDLNSSILDVLGGLWATQDADKLADAANITKMLIEPLVPRGLQWAFTINGSDVVYNSTAINITNFVSVSRKAASGFARNQSSTGYAASATLGKIFGKEDSKYFFFGGFIGQGNITATIRGIPFNATIQKIYLEVNAIDNFSMYINNDYCATFNLTNAGGFGVNNWTVTNQTCLDLVQDQAVNNFTFRFLNKTLSSAYFGGGYLKVQYSTDEFLPVPMFRYYFAGAEGAANIYDSFYVIGNITNMTIRLHLYTDLQTFLQIGNATIWEVPEGNGTLYDIKIFNDTIAAQLAGFGLTYPSISSTTNPLRFGHRAGNFSNGTGGVDAVITTGNAGSMSLCKLINDGSLPSCGGGNATLYDGTRPVAKKFVEVVLNGTSGNRISHFGYRNNAPQPSNTDQALTNNINSLYTVIDAVPNPPGGAKRCLACAIAEARARLLPLAAKPETDALDALPPKAPYSSYSKIRAVLLMTDGNPDQCDNSDESVGSYSPSCSSSQANKQSIDLACQTRSISPYAKNGNNITIYAVGFGPYANMSLLSTIANCTGGKAYSSSNYSELLQIYEDIAKEITKTVTFLQQVVSVQGSNSTLYPDSYIEFQYDSATPDPGYKEISLNAETDVFPSCNGSFFVPPSVRIMDARRTAYSSDFWTKAVSINNSLTGNLPREIFNLSNYNEPAYVNLGDPFNVYLPVELFGVNQTNYANNVLGNSTSYNSPICSQYDRVIYTLRLKASTTYTDVFPEGIGRNVTVYYDNNHDGVWDGFSYVAVGSNLPEFDPNPVNASDLSPGTNAVDNAFIQLLNQLNLVTTYGNLNVSGTIGNPIDIILTADLNVQVDLLSLVPYVWGPSDMSISFWV